MADNTKQSADDNIATDEISSGVAAGAKVQRSKVGFGANGSYTDVEESNPLPVVEETAASLLPVIFGLLSSIDVDTGNLATILTRLTEIEEDTDRLTAIQTAVELIDNVVAGSEMQVDVITLPELPAGTKNIGQVDPRGNVAHDSADSGNPVKVGGRARTNLPAAVAQDDRSDLITDKFGRQTAVAAPLDQRVSGSIDLTDTTTTDVIAAPGASTAIVVTNIGVSNGGDEVGTFVEILDDATKKWKKFAGANGGGWNVQNEDGLFVCTANKAVRAKCLTTGSETSVNISGYKIPA